MRAVRQVLVSERLGGGEIVALQLARAAAARGWRASAWVPGAGPAAAALTDAHVRVTTFDLEALQRSASAQVIAYARLLPDLFRERALVHIHSPAVFGLLRPLLRAARARVVVHVHLEQTPDELAWLLKSPPDRVVTCAHYLEAQVRQAGGSAVTTVANAVDTDRFVPGDRMTARRLAGLDTNRFVVLMLANLAPHKGQATTVRAVGALRDRGVPVEAWLVGEDRDPSRAAEQALRVLTHTLDLDDHVKFLGFRRDAKVLLQAADAFVLPSTHEGLPLSVLEAQAAGVPVIGSDIPGILEVIEQDRTGFIVPAADHEGYAARLAQLFRDEGTRRRLITAASAVIARDHRRPIMEDRMFAVYDEVQGR